MTRLFSYLALALVLVSHLTAASAVYASPLPEQLHGPRDTSWSANRRHCPAVYTDHEYITAIGESVEPETTMLTRASWYGNQFHGNTMRYGAVFHECDATVVAYNNLPGGTVLRVRNRANNRTIMVVVQDTGGPLVSRRLDLSRGAAQLLDPEYATKGVLQVEVEVLGQPTD